MNTLSSSRFILSKIVPQLIHGSSFLLRFLAKVAVLYPNDALQKDIANRTYKLVEIFKMQGGEEYVMHDINEINIIVRKSRFSGNVWVSESMSVV